MKETVLPKLDDFDTNTIGPLRGAHGQQLVEALRKLDRAQASDSSGPHPYWDLVETWPGIIVGLWGTPADESGNMPAVPNPAMYCVQKCYVGSGLTSDPIKFYPALDDPNKFYPATNVLELLSGTNQVQIGQPVLVFSYIDRGVTNRKRYLFIADRPIAWISITSPQPPTAVTPTYTGGGAYYNASLVSGSPVTNDPTISLIAPISPNESVGPTNQICAVNCAEANLGDPPTHSVQCPVFAPAWLIGYTNETVASTPPGPRPVYRFFIPRPGPVDASIIQPLGSIGGVSAGRYEVSVMLGSVVGLDPATNFHGTDPGTQYPNAYNAYWTDVYEGGSASNGTTIMLSGAFVRGSFVGMAMDGKPAFYGSSAPSGTTFRINLTPNGGVQGTSSAQATWAYDGYCFDGSLQLFTAQQPESATSQRPLGQISQALIGLGRLSATGAMVFAEAVEPPINSLCTPVSGYAQNSMGPASLYVG